MIDGEVKLKRSLAECGNISVENEIADVMLNVPELFKAESKTESKSDETAQAIPAPKRHKLKRNASDGLTESSRDSKSTHTYVVIARMKRLIDIYTTGLKR